MTDSLRPDSLPSLPLPDDQPTPAEWQQFLDRKRQQLHWSILASAMLYLSLASLTFFFFTTRMPGGPGTVGWPADGLAVAKIGIVGVLLFLMAVLYLFYNIGTQHDFWPSVTEVAAPAWYTILQVSVMPYWPTPLLRGLHLLILITAAATILCQARLGWLRGQLAACRNRWNLTTKSVAPARLSEEESSLPVDKGWDESGPVHPPNKP